MLFNSIDFLLFFPIVVVSYYAVPQKFRYLQLLAASYFFYMCWNAKYAILLLFSTFVTYVCAIVLEKIKHRAWSANKMILAKKGCVAVGLLLNLSVLFFFKYLNFTIINMNRVLNLLHIEFNIPEWDFLLPVGISFYVFQAIGYMVDVYRDEIYAERNFFRYALFISFFPQLVAGPIERSKNLLVQLYMPKKLRWDNFLVGFFYMLWGLFLKMTIADRAAIIVDTVYEDPIQYPGFFIIVATILFAFQIYCDFYGYSIIAKGAARILDIHLMDNFNAPYFSRNVKEFWARWHISLSSWFRDYLYIPLGGNRKGQLRKNINLMVVMGTSGLWHGASISYILWGLINGGYQVIRDIFTSLSIKYNLKIKNHKESFSLRLRQRSVTFILICFSWIFFRAGDMSDVWNVISNMFLFNWNILFDGSLYLLGVKKEFFGMLCLCIGILLYIDSLKYKGIDVMNKIMKQEWWLKIMIYVVLFCVVVLFGCYGVEYDTNQFIYFQF